MINVTHRMPTRAILFSDLHYSYETKDTCFEVLRFISNYASKKHARVYFLGDFWDHIYRRGTIPVDLLNEMIRFFKEEWAAVMTMIPGNHDYFDSAEKEHGLEAFKDINNIRVLDEPTLEDGILFLPFRKDHSLFKAIIDEAQPKLILGHLDIVGAKMNHSRVCTNGCDKDIFNVPTFSGHYHTASVYGNVHYIGSTYQIHLGEAGDKKQLTVINYKNGLIEDRIPIEFGRRHFKVKSLKDLPVEPRAGDRIVLETHEEPDAIQVKELKDHGIIVEHKKKIQMPIDVQPHSVYDDPIETLNTVYTIEDIDLLKIFKEDKILSELYDRRKKEKTLQMKRHVDFKTMTIHNFGPFMNTHVIDFEKGVTLFTGKYGNNSNGAGKSLCSSGALLWICSGKTDPRMGGTHMSNDVISMGQNSCHIILNGCINGKPFTICRNMTRQPKSHSLTFHVDGNDNGGNTINNTQTKIGKVLFGTKNVYDWLIKSVIWTQRHSPRFIDATDSNAKRELSSLMDLEWWNDVHNRVKDLCRLTNNDVFHEEKHLDHLKERLCDRLHVMKNLKEDAESWNIQQTLLIDEVQREHAEICKLIPTEHPEEFKDHETLCLKRTQLGDYQLYLKHPDISYLKPEELVKKWCLLASENDIINKQIDKLQTSGVCETCSRPIDPDELVEHITSLKNKLHDLSVVDKEIDDHLEAYKVKKIAQAEEEIAKLEPEVKELTEKKRIWQIYDKNKYKLQDILHRFGRLSKQKNPVNDKIDMIQSHLDNIKADMDITKAKYQRLQNYEKLMKKIRGWVGPHGIQLVFQLYTIRYLEHLIQDMMDDHKLKLKGDFNTNKIRKTYNGQKLSTMSGGEYQQLQVFSFLAYRQILGHVCEWSCNLMIFDEPDTFVDASGVKKMMHTIKDQTKDMCTIIISHTNSMHRDMTLFEHHVEIERDHNGSKKRKRT